MKKKIGSAPTLVYPESDREPMARNAETPASDDRLHGCPTKPFPQVCRCVYRRKYDAVL